MHTLTLLAHVASEQHTHSEGFTFILAGLALGGLFLYFRKTA